MSIKLKLAAIFLSCTSFCFGFNLTPSIPVQVSPGGSADSNNGTPIATTNLSQKIMMTWIDSNEGAVASFSSDKGQTWSTGQLLFGQYASCPIGSTPSSSQGFLIPWFGYEDGFPHTTFYNTILEKWGTAETPISTIDPNVQSYSSIIFVNKTPGGFVAALLDDSLNGYVNISSDGTSWLSPSVKIFDSSFNGAVSSISACGNNTLYLATWIDNSNGELYISTSQDKGLSWSFPTSILSLGGAAPASASSFCCANNSGFLISYLDLAGNVKTISSSDGIHWNSPVVVVPYTSNATCGNAVYPISGNDYGFVLTWFDGASAGWARFTGDNGATWEDPVKIVEDGGLPSSFYYYGISSSVYQNLCMFGWTNNDGQVWISTSPFPYVFNLNKKNSGLMTPNILTKPGKPFNR
ncbi:MAG: hypothetical protein LVR00_00270 [Rhabdochlamydiaceae bacterium]|jgi:hypothetical protein